MLVASLDGVRIEAEHAPRGRPFVCPECRQAVVLKRGRIVVAHFAHKPHMVCDWARGETPAHLEAKRLFRDAFAARGYEAEVERVVPTLPGDRRADVMVRGRSGIEAAIELQHNAIGLDEIERRAFAYARAGIAQAWVPFLRPSVLAAAEPSRGGEDGDLLVKRYVARPFERWIHGLNHGGLWLYDPAAKNLWFGRLAGHQVYLEPARWYATDGEERHGGGLHRWSRRWRELTLWGPCELARVKIEVRRRQAWRSAIYRWPAGFVARFVALR
jgi:competence protein CoiA